MEIGVDPGVGTQLRQQIDPHIAVLSDCPEDLAHREALTDQCARQFKGISVHRLPDGEDRARKSLPEGLCSLQGFLFPFLILKDRIQYPSESRVLGPDPVDLVKPSELYKGYAEAFLQIVGRRTGLRIEDKIEICLRHGQKLVVIPAGTDLTDLPDPGLTQKGEKLTALLPLLNRGKKSQNIYGRSFLLPGFEKFIDRLPYVNHGRFPALPGQSIHIAGLHTDTGHLLLSPSADALHVSP